MAYSMLTVYLLDGASAEIEVDLEVPSWRVASKAQKALHPESRGERVIPEEYSV